MRHTVGPHVFSWLGLSEGHHSLSHIDDSNPTGVAHFVEAERYLAEEFAYLLSKLDSLPEPDGEGTLLDHTTVLWAQELGDGRLHDCHSVPFVLAGGGGGYFNTGQYLDLEGNPTRSSSYPCASPWGLRTRLSETRPSARGHWRGWYEPVWMGALDRPLLLSGCAEDSVDVVRAGPGVEEDGTSGEKSPGWKTPRAQQRKRKAVPTLVANPNGMGKTKRTQAGSRGQYGGAGGGRRCFFRGRWDRYGFSFRHGRRRAGWE